MTESGDYMKDVQTYFISLAGEGIMLSSADYAIISDLRKRGVPKEVVLLGINRAFSEARSKDRKGAVSIRNIKQCSTYIEESVVKFSPIKERKISESAGGDRGGIIGETAHKLSEFIKDEKREDVKDFYTRLRTRVLEMDRTLEENALGVISELEVRCLEQFFSALSEGEMESITLEAGSKVKGRGRYMTDRALGESIISFRNEIIHNKYGIRYIFTYDQG